MAVSETRRVLCVSHYVDLYGANRSLLSFVVGCRAFGWNAHVVVPSQGPMTEALAEQGIAFSIIPMQVAMVSVERARTWLRAPLAVRWLCRYAISEWRVLKLVRRLAPQAIHTNASVTYNGMIAAAISRIPHLWHWREYGLEDYGLVPVLGGRVHRWFAGRTRACIAVSGALADALSQRYRVPRPHVIYNGVSMTSADAPRFDGPDQNAGPIRVLMLGRIQPGKRQIDLVEALALLDPDVVARFEVAIVGGGTQHDISVLRQAIEDHDLGGVVQLAGETKDPTAAIHLADVLVHCARHEGMGRVIVEAMGAARLVIVPDEGGAAELVSPGRTGLRFSGVRGLADRLRAVAATPAAITEIGESAARFAAERFSERQYVSHVVDQLEAAVARRSATLDVS